MAGTLTAYTLPFDGDVKRGALSFALKVSTHFEASSAHGPVCIGGADATVQCNAPHQTLAHVGHCANARQRTG